MKDNKEYGQETNNKESRTLKEIKEILKETLYKKFTLKEGVQSLIGISLCIIFGSAVYDIGVPVPADSSYTDAFSSLNAASLVLWTASCSFLLFSVERMEIRSLGIRLRDILETMIPRRTLKESLAVIFMEMMVLITAEVFNWRRTGIILAFLQIINAMIVFYIVVRYSSRKRALIEIKNDACKNIKKLDGRAHLNEISLWEGRRLYAIIRLLIYFGEGVYFLFNVLVDKVLDLFMGRTSVSLEKNGLDGIQRHEWLILKMSRSIDYKNGEDCSALEAMLRETLCKNEFEGQRYILFKCIRLILSESDNSYHSAMLISNLYNSGGSPECRMNIRKAILEALLERGTQENLNMALQLGMIERALPDSIDEEELRCWKNDEEELRCWKYVCMRTFKHQIQMEQYLLLNFYNDSEPFEQSVLLKAVSALAMDQEMGVVETLQRVCM